MDVLLVLGFLMLVVTVVGHGIWLFVAFLFRSLAEPYQGPPTVAPSTSPKRICPHCGALCATTFQNCPTCGKLVEEQPRSPAAQLQTIQRQLDQLLAEEVLSLEQFESARLILQEATDKHKVPSVEKPPTEKPVELPVLEADEAAVSEGKVFNLPAAEGHVENVPHERSTWTDWLQAFLEEKNIRWGELLAGLLIVGSSVGLVISLWSTLRNAIPYFPALCFLAVTAAIHGAGLYSLRHWRLKTTSRGLLTIALLLVPLNFLAAIALSEQRSATDPLYVTAVAIGLVAYGWITWSGTRELMHFGAAWLSLAVLGSAIGQLMIGRRTSAGLSTLELNGLFALPLATYVVALLAMSLFVARWRRRTPRRIESLYRLLGIAFFSLAVALGLLLWKSQAVLDTLSRLSPCVSLAAAMIVGVAGRLLPNVGYVFNVPVKRGHVGNVPHDIAATAVALIGAMLMVAAVVLAWPDPERLIAVGLVNFVALSWFGFASSLAPLHAPALGCLALAGLIAFHRFGQAIGGAGISDERNLINTILLGRSGVVVALMSLLTTAVAVVLWRNGSAGASPSQRREHAMSYLAAAAGMAVLSLGIAGYAGFWPHVVQPSIDRSLPTIVFVLFGIVGMVANERLNRIEIAWSGAVVWLAVFLHALGWNTHLREWLDGLGLLPDRPIVIALLSFATWSLGCAVVGKVRNRFVTPWSAASGRAIVVAVFALPWKVWGDFGPHAIYLGWIAALCLGQAHLWQSRNLFSLSQVLAFIATSLGVTAFAQHQEWWLASHDDLLAFRDVRHWHFQLAGLAVACVPWVLWRRFGGRLAVLSRCSDWKIDRVVRPIVVIAAAVTLWFSLWPFLGFERYQHPTLWPVVLQPWIGRGWDRVLLWLIGWGAVTWSVEEVTRRWFDCRAARVPTAMLVRFPWMGALGTIVIGSVMFLLPQIYWHNIPLSQRLRTIDPRPLFGPSMSWAVAGVLGASLVSLFERGHWKTRLLFIAVWCAVWQFGSSIVTSSVISTQSWSGNIDLWWGWQEDFVFGWLTLSSIALVLATGLLRLVVWIAAKWRPLRRPRAGTFASDAWGVTCYLWLWPMVVLGPQVSLQGGTEMLAFVWLYWTALMLSRACRTRSMALMFGASHAWCLAFAGIALLSYYDRVRMLIPFGDEAAAFVRFLGWSAGALAVFGMVWRALQNPASWVARPESSKGVEENHALRKDSGRATPMGSLFELSPSWWDWAREPRAATITPWLWQQLWMWSCVWLGSLLAAIVVLSHVPPTEAWWLAFQATSVKVGFVLALCCAMATEQRWANRVHSLGLWSLVWMPVLAAAIARQPSDRIVVWLAGWTALAVAWTVARCFAVEARRETSLWSDAASLGVVLLACWEFATRHAVVWPASCVAVVAVISAVLAGLHRSQIRAAASTFYVVLGTAMVWTRDWDGLRARNDRQLLWWLEASVTALALAACAWQAVEVWWQARRGERFDPSSRFTAAEISSRIAFDAALSIVLLVVLSQLLGPGWSIHELGGWLMVLAVAAPFAVSWWDRFAKGTVDGIYGTVWLLLLMVLIARRPHFGESWLTFLTGLIAVDIALVGAAWRIAKGSAVFATLSVDSASESSKDDVKQSLDLVALRASRRDRVTDAERWLPSAELVWALVASALVLLGVLTFGDRGLRFWNVASAALLVPGIALMARSQRRDLLQRVTLALGAVWAVEFLWAWMEPRPHADLWLQRSIRTLEALAITAFVYGVVLARWIRFDSDWRAAVERAARDVAFSAIATLLIVLGLEAWWFDPVNGAPVTGLQIAFVAAALVGLAAALLVMALSNRESRISDFKSQISNLKSEVSEDPAREPQSSDIKSGISGRKSQLSDLTSGMDASSDLKSEIWNLKSEWASSSAFVAPQMLVYAAEILMGLLFLHVYLTMPELFRGYFRPYWPLIVMAIAFTGVGASELCQRAKLKVLSEPFQHSAALLPLIPALGFWIATSRLDYSTVLFLAGLVYVWLNLRRRSFWYVLAASLAGNVGLWSLWSEHGVELLVRPQVWLIPPAVSVLAAAQWNRARLTEAQLAAIRYPAITLLYVSSAGEMFLTGIAESFWLPIVLMVLSVLGVLAGIWLRVRAFLYLGVSFLLLSLVSMVWHAAEAIDHTWPWWAFGIGLGLGVLTLFGLFERKRNEMLRLVGELRTWER